MKKIRNIILLLTFLSAGSSNMQLKAQSCSQPTLLIRSGWDYGTNLAMTPGSPDPYWMVVQDEDVSTTEPRPAIMEGGTNALYTINSGSATNVLNNWCCQSYTSTCNPVSNIPCTSNPAFYNGGLGPGPTGSYADEPRIFTFTFCIDPGADLNSIVLDYSFYADDYAKVCLNGSYIGSNSSCSVSVGNTCHWQIGAPGPFQHGKNVVEVTLYNLGGSITYFAFDGTVTAGPGQTPFSDPNCCSAPGAHDRIITGTKYWDKDGDGIRDAGEPSLSNWQIVLKDQFGNPMASSTTDVYGNFMFNGLAPGIYQVEEVQQNGFTQTFPAAPSHVVNLNMLSIATNINFGNQNIPCCSSGISMGGSGLMNISSTGTVDVFTADNCLVDQLNLSATCSGVSSYTWNFGDGTSSNSSSPSHLYASPGSYPLTMTVSGSGCFQTQTIVVNAQYTNCPACCTPSVDITGTGLGVIGNTGNSAIFTASHCRLDPLNLTASCATATSYVWNFGDGSQPSTQANPPAHTYTATNVYTLTLAALGSGCAQIQTVIVSSSYSNCPSCCSPSITISGSGLPSILPTGNPLVFTANNCMLNPLNLTANCAVGNTYHWDFGDGFVYTGATAPAHTYSAAGFYTLSISAIGTSCAQTQSIVINVSYNNCSPCCTPMSITGSGLQNLTPTGNPLISTAGNCLLTPLNLSANCGSASTFTWNFGDGSFVYIGSTPPAHSYSAAGMYTLTVSAAGVACAQTQTVIIAASYSNCCCTPSISLTGSGLGNLSATGNPTIFVANNCVITPLSLNASCGSASSYNWDYGDGSNATSSNPSPHTYAGPGTYTMIISASGAACSQTQAVIVTSSYSVCSPCCSPSINITGTGLSPINATGNASVFTSSNCLVTPMNLSASCPNANTFLWNFGDGYAYNGTTPPAHSYANAGTYTITVTAQNVTCYQSQVIVVQASYTNCPSCCSPSIQINGTGLTNLVPTGTSTVFTANNCLLSPLALSASCGTVGSFFWNFGDGYTYTGTNPPNHTYASPGTYTLHITSISTSCYISQKIVISANYANCPPCCNPLNISGTGLQNLTGTSNPTVFTASNCLVTPLILSTSCVPNATYYWNFGDGFTFTGPNPPAHTYATQGNYVITLSVVATGVSGCTQGKVINVAASYSNCAQCCPNNLVVGGTGLTNFAATTNPTIYLADNCMASPLALNVSCPPGPVTNYHWDFGDGFISNAPTPPQHSYANPGNYNLLVTVWSTSCYQQQLIQVTSNYNVCPPCSCPVQFVSATSPVPLQPGPHPSVSVVGLCLSAPLVLQANCPGITNYLWDFADGYKPTGSNPSHQYANSGVYSISLTAVGNNCASHQRIDATVSYSNCPPCCNSNYLSGNGFQYFNTTITPSVYVAGACPNTNFNLNISNCPGAASYSWNFGDGNSSTNSSPTHQYNSINTYNINAGIVGPNCYTGFQIQVASSPTNCPPCCPGGFVTSAGLYNLSPTGNPNIYTAYVCVNTALNLSAGSCAGTSNYLWNFGNGTTASGSNANATYASTGNYTLTVQAWGATCSVPTQTVLVTVTNSNMIFPATSCAGPVMLSANTCLYAAGASYSWDFGDGSGPASGANVSHTYNSPGQYNVKLYVTIGGSTTTYNQTIQIDPCDPPQCTNCIGSFAPEPGEYMINLWVREDISPLPTTYSNAQVHISFKGHASTYAFGPDITKNKIVEGWQRIEEPFTVPVGATHLNLRLINNVSQGGPDAYFDDIRIFPKDGQMKTYVYDPVTLKLSAVLDENNYATYYEYDEEGKLIRTKKETEKGIMTIQENREGLKSK